MRDTRTQYGGMGGEAAAQAREGRPPCGLACVRRGLAWSGVFLLIFLIISHYVPAAPVDEGKARAVAAEWAGKVAARRPGAALGLGKARPGIPTEAQGRRVGYLYPGDAGGFVLVAADDVLSPVLAYSEDTDFDPTVPVVAVILRSMAAKVDALEGAGPDEMWAELGEGGEGEEPLLGAYGQFGPLLDSRWSQGNPYNRDCPIDPSTSQRSVVGCVATAMAQLMRFHGYPLRGKGEHFYERWGGLISADFEVDYAWGNMPTYVTTWSPQEQIEAVAELSYHCGVAVDMMYSSSGSGAYMSDAAMAFWRYFQYAPYFALKYRSGYDSAEWFGLMEVEVTDGRPVMYAIRDELGRGHAIVLDGTDDGGMFVHLNVGWGGMSDGWYSIDDFSFPSPPGTWNVGHYAIVGVEPDDYAEEKFTKADLSGRWEFTTRGGYGYIVSDGAGSVEEGEFTDGTGTYAVTWGYYTVGVDGALDMTIQTDASGYPQFDWLGTIAKSRDLAAVCDENPSPVSGFDLCLLVKSKGSFANADLGGTWAFAGVRRVGEVTTNGAGNVTGGWYESASVAAAITGGSYGVGADGSFWLIANIDSVAEPELSLQGHVTSGKDVAVGADGSFSLGHSDITMLAKAKSPASAADLDKRYTLGGMRWMGEAHADGSGGMTGGTFTWKNGTGYSITGGSYTVNGDGTMSGTILTTNPSAASVGFEGVMNEGGDVALCWNPSVDGGEGTSVFLLLSMHNRAPEFSSATLAPSPAYETSTLSVTKTGWDDDDGDAEGYLYRWKKNGVNIPGATGATLNGTYFDADDSISCVVRAWDGVSAGKQIETAAVVIEIGGIWTIMPENPEIAVGEYLNFQMSTGGDGVWSLVSAPSGGEIAVDTGVYQSGGTGGVDDEVSCSDGGDLAGTTVTVTTSPRPPGTVGPATSMDVDGGGLGISDVVLMLRHVVGLEILTGEQIVAADFDWDGTITMSDVVNAMRGSVGLKPGV